MTSEHLPARATGNDTATTMYRDYDGAFILSRHFTDGHALPCLCGECNHGASHRRLPQAYTAWHHDVVDHIRFCAATYQHNTGGDPTDFWYLFRPGNRPLLVSMEHGRSNVDPRQMNNLHPGRIARQILGGVLAVQNDRQLLDGHPQLKAAYFANGPASIAPFTLHIALADAGIAYLTTAAAALSIDLSTGRSTMAECWVISFPPFLMLLVNGDTAPITATRIDHWFQQPLTATFTPGNRTVEYPVALHNEPLVGKLYADLDRLPPIG